MRLRNSFSHWGLIAIFIHWLSTITVFGLFGLGLWMVELEYYHAWYHDAPKLHKSIGILLFVMTLVRIIWRRCDCIPVALANHSPRQRKIATATHYSLYVLLIIIMLSGYLISTAEGHSVAVFNWLHVPALFFGIDKQENIAGVVHLWVAISLASLAVLHGMAAIKHHFIDQDKTLKRMFGL